MANYGFKVSKDGFDVQAASVGDLALNSSSNTFKIKDAQTGSWTVISGNKFGSETIILTGHSVPPIYLIFIEVNNKNYYVNNGGFIENVDGSNDLFLYTYVDNANPAVLTVIADPNANPIFAANRTLDYYLYLGLDNV